MKHRDIQDGEGQHRDTGLYDIKYIFIKSEESLVTRDYQPNKDVTLFNFFKNLFSYNQVAPDYNIIQYYQITVSMLSIK